jgi:hypothetical protein
MHQHSQKFAPYRTSSHAANSASESKACYSARVISDLVHVTEPTVAVRVLDELRRCRAALDDDELARRLDVSPRQTINQVCRRLERSGRLRRYVGPAGKIVNDLRRDDGPAAPASAPASADRTPDIVGRLGDVGPTAAGDSREQRHAEQVMLTVLSHRYGVTLTPRRILLDDGIRVEVDGADTELTILVEAWAHQGPPKAAQKHKVLADVLKLLHIAATLPVAPRLVLCLSDPEAAHHFTSARSWAAHALRGFAIEIVVVELPADVRAAILAAQQRQYR